MKLLSVSAAAAALLLVCGCGGPAGDAPETHAVSGTATFDGEPVPEASLVFEDPDGKDRSFGAIVSDGAWSTEMTAGPKRVRITATRTVPGKTEPGPSGEEAVPATEQYLPPKYNTETTLEIEVTPDGPNEFPFDLTSD